MIECKKKEKEESHPFLQVPLADRTGTTSVRKNIYVAVTVRAERRL